MFIKHLSQKKGKFGIFETAVTQGSRSYPKRCFASKDPKQARRPRAKKNGRDMWLWRSRWFRIVIWVIWMIQWHIHTNIQLSEFELSVSWSSWHKKCFQRMFRSKCFKQMQSWLKLDDFVYSAWKAWNIYWVSQNWSIGALISHYELITSKESCPRLWKDLGQPWVEVRTYWDQWVWIFVLFGALSSPEGHRNDGGGLDLCLPDLRQCLRQWHLLDWHETVLLESSVLQACNKTVIDLFSNVFWGVMNWRMYFWCHQLRLSIIYLPAPLLAAYCLVYPWLHWEVLLVNWSSIEGFKSKPGRLIWIYHCHPRGGWPRPFSNIPPRGFLKIRTSM